MKTLAERLNYALNRKKMKMAELARRIGVRPQSIQYLCKSGKKSAYTVDIARVLGVNPNWLANGKGDIDDSDSVSSMNPVKARIIEILESAQAAIDHSGEDFTDEELIDLYMDALEFGLEKGFSEKLVRIYVDEMLKNRSKKR